MDPGSPVSTHLRRRRELEAGQHGSRGGGRSGAGDHVSRAALDSSNSGARSNTGGRSGTGAITHQRSGIEKDKSAHGGSPHGGTQVFHDPVQLDGTGSPKIGAYHGPISSITKHYFMVSPACLVGAAACMVIPHPGLTWYCSNTSLQQQV